MVTYVLDSTAVLRYLDGEAGSARVAEIIKNHLAGSVRAVVAAIHWGELAGITCKVRGAATVDLVLSRLMSFGLVIVPADGDRAVRAAMLKLKYKIAYADAFGVELAMESADHVLVTADLDLKPAARDAKIEFLPRK